MTFLAEDDTSLFEGKPDSDLGGTTLLAGSNQQFAKGRALVRFKLDALPAGVVVTGVEVRLHVTRRPDPDQHGGPADSDFSLYRMFVSWGEGTGSQDTGSVAIPNAATWNSRHHGSIAWATPGGQIGTDFANNPSATTTVSDLGPYSWGSSTELVDDVKSWIADPSANYGFMLISQGESQLGTGRRFSSSEQPGGLISPPQLVVTFNLVPEPGVIGLLVLPACFALRRRR
jgi:hypothetical protein